ncbi:MAG: 3-phosphoshikimate 1-carboxyvinyltransferase [Bacteroidia bacterium]
MSQPFFQSISGTVNLPASKSLSNRMIALQFMADDNDAAIVNLSEAQDTLLMLNALTSENNEIDLENAGTAFRFLTACFAAKGMKKILTGSKRMQKRPVAQLTDALRQLGADFRYHGKEGYPPVEIIQGIQRGGSVKIKAGISSQYISALLLIAPFLPNGLQLEIGGDQVSKPYVELTLRLLAYHGVEFERSIDRIDVPEQPVTLRPMLIENDWSAASYIYALAALAGKAEILLPGLHPQSWQGDSIMVEWMEAFGIKTQYFNRKCFIQKSNTNFPSEFNKDLTDYPDLAQTFAVLCSLMKIPFHLKGIKNLRVKECDRLKALETELRKLGTETEAGADSLQSLSFGEVPRHPVRISTYNDHRMAMSFAPFGMIYPNVKIDDPEVVQKSFPGFWRELERLKRSPARGSAES